MAVPVWAIGQVLSAADVNNWFVPIVAVKPADTGRATTTAMTADPDLLLPVAANATYDISGCLFYTGPNTASDLKFTYTLPASASGQYFPCHQNISGIFTGSFAQQWTDTVTANTPGTSTANLMVVFVKGILLTSGTAGNITLSWAQNTSNGTTTMRANSFLSAQRMG